MVTTLQLDVGLILRSHAGLDQVHRGAIDYMIMDCPIDQERLIHAIEVAAYVGPEEGLRIERRQRQSVVAALVLTWLGNVIDDA